MEKVEVYAWERKKIAQLKQEVGGKAFKYLVSMTTQQVKSIGRI